MSSAFHRPINLLVAFLAHPFLFPYGGRASDAPIALLPNRVPPFLLTRAYICATDAEAQPRAVQWLPICSQRAVRRRRPLRSAGRVAAAVARASLSVSGLRCPGGSAAVAEEGTSVGAGAAVNHSSGGPGPGQ